MVKRKRTVSPSSFYGRTARDVARSVATTAAKRLLSTGAKYAWKTAVNRWRQSKGGMKKQTKSKNRARGRPQDVNLDTTGLHKRDLGLVVMGKKAKYEKLLGTYQYRNINQWVINGLQGHQVADFAEVYMTRDMLVGSTSNQRGERYKWYDDPAKLNPYWPVQPTDVYPNAQPTVVPLTDLVYVKNLKTITHLLNMTKIPMNVDVYWVTPKYDTNVNPIESWDAIFLNKSLGQTAPVGSTVTTSATADAGRAQSIDYGSNPFHHREFAKVWKCVKSSHVIAQAGEQVDLYLDFTVEKIVSRSNLTNSRLYQFLKGVSVFPLFIARCGLEGISTAENAASSEVAYGQVKLGVVSNQLYTFGALPTSRVSTARTYTGTIVSTTQVEKTIDDNDMVVDVKPNM